MAKSSIKYIKEQCYSEFYSDSLLYLPVVQACIISLKCLFLLNSDHCVLSLFSILASLL